MSRLQEIAHQSFGGDICLEACEIGIAIGIAIRIARTQTEGHAVIILHNKYCLEQVYT